MTKASIPAGALCLLLSVAACSGENLFPPYPITGAGTTTPGTIEGAVTAGAPLGGVSIILIDRDSTVTDGQGRYRFTGLPASTYSLALRVPLNYTLAPGDSAIRRVQVGAGGIAQANWNLVSQGVEP